MKLIIDIPADVYDDIQHNKGEYVNTLNWAVRNGTLYNPSGDCISRSALKTELETYRHTRNYKSDEDEAQNALLDNVLEDIDEAQAVCGNDPRWCERCVSKGKCSSTRPKGDLISREALKDIAYINKGNFNTVEGIREWIDNAQAIPLPNEQIAWEQGFEAGLAQAVEITEEQAINKLHETGWLIGHDKEMTERPQGEWIDHSETDGYVECPFCGSCTTCEDNKDELHFCFNCGADMRKGGAE